jgi:pyruvate dehydrogenase E2 component (dihydrolipoamide acetyltransferase)
MSKDVYIPKLGQTVEEVQLVRWLAEDGAQVEPGQEILEVETDKAIFTVEATARGYLHTGPFQPGETLPVLTVVARIGAQNETWFEHRELRTNEQTNKRTNEQEACAESREPRIQHSEPENREPGTEHREPENDKQWQSSGEIAQNAPPLLPSSPPRHVASPRARKFAQAHNVDLSHVTATGSGGTRIVERDVQMYLERQNGASVQSPLRKATPLARKIAAEAGLDLNDLSGGGRGGRITRSDVVALLDGHGDGDREIGRPGDTQADKSPISNLQSPISNLQSPISQRVPLAGVRAIVAQRMAASAQTAARVTLMMEVDATEFVTLRARLKARLIEAWGFAPNYDMLIAKIVAGALRQFPYMNARLTEDAIEYLTPINLGFAVDTERGLLVPVIRDVADKNLRQIGEAFRSLVERARAGRALPDELTGGTFTITNLGMFDVDAFTPIINLPEAAILGLGRIIEKPVMRDGQVVGRQMWTLSLAFDHRLTDGAPAAKFLRYIKEMIEEPYLLVTL